MNAAYKLLKRWLWIALGILLVILGVAGIILPIMPGIIFLVPGITILSYEIPWVKRRVGVFRGYLLSRREQILRRLEIKFPILYQKFFSKLDKLLLKIIKQFPESDNK